MVADLLLGDLEIILHDEYFAFWYINFPDETETYRIPKRAQATTSLIVIDPLQQVAEPAALARSQTFDFLREVQLIYFSTFQHNYWMFEFAKLKKIICRNRRWQ